MKNGTGILGGLVAVVCACCVVLAALMVGPGPEDCPRPSARSIAALFSPCQAPTVASAGSAELSPPEEIQAEERQAIAREHATVGVSR
jgi:hypothetical protein